MPDKQEIILYFGSFNPIHIGHLAIANYITEFCDKISELWFVVTPQNPHKNSNTLIKDRDRQHMVQLAIEDYHKFKVSDIEFYLPKPNYTVKTLAYLSDKYPKKKFSLLIGGDNLETFHKWKDYQLILDNYKIYVYKRPNHKVQEFKNSNIEILNAPQIEVSSQFIRDSIKKGKDIRYFLHPKVLEYVIKMAYWK